MATDKQTNGRTSSSLLSLCLCCGASVQFHRWRHDVRDKSSCGDCLVSSLFTNFQNSVCLSFVA